MPKSVAQCQKYPIPYLNTLNRIIPYLNTLSRTTPYLNTLGRTLPYLNTLSRTLPYLNTLPKYFFTWHPITTRSAGVITVLWPHNYFAPWELSARASLQEKIISINFIFEKVSQCRKWVIPFFYTLGRTIAYAYTLPKAIAYLNTYFPILIHALPILILWLSFRLLAPYLITCIAYLNTLSRLSAPYPNTCTASLNTLCRPPILIHRLPPTRLGNQSESSTLGSRQPIRIDYYVTRVVS